MKRNVWVFGLIAGAIVSGFMAFGTVSCMDKADFSGSMLIGYASMILAFSFVFVGIKNYRDKYNNGLITFKKAFITGLYISLIASTMYVINWLIVYYFFMPDFMDKYAMHMINEAKATGATQAEIDRKAAEMAKYSEMYKNPLFVVLLTYMEILPVGLLITVLCSLVLKKTKKSGKVELTV
jgi:hypothetical protein